MLLGGGEHFIVKNCKRLDSGLNCCLMTYGLFRFKKNVFPPAAPPHLPRSAGEALLQIARVVQLGPLKLPRVYLNLLFWTVEGGWGFLLLKSPVGNITPKS